MTEEKLPSAEQRRLTNEDLQAIEEMRARLIERGELRFLHPVAASLIEHEIPLLTAEVRQLWDEGNLGRISNRRGS